MIECGTSRSAAAGVGPGVRILFVGRQVAAPKRPFLAAARRKLGETSMQQIELAVQSLLSAGSVPGVLTAGWDAFELLRAGSAASADRSASLYPAFTFARGSAVSGRNAIAFAPSMPGGHAAPVEGLEPPASDAHEVADALVDLASALSARLRDAARLAGHPDDRAACEKAARHADHIRELLARGT